MIKNDALAKKREQLETSIHFALKKLGVNPNCKVSLDLRKSIPILAKRFREERIQQEDADHLGRTRVAILQLRKISKAAANLREQLRSASGTTLSSLSEAANELSVADIDQLDKTDFCVGAQSDDVIGDSLDSLIKLVTIAEKSLKTQHEPRRRGGSPSESAYRWGSPEFRLMIDATFIAAMLGLEPSEKFGYALARLAFESVSAEEVPTQWMRNEEKRLRKWWKQVQPLFIPVLSELRNVPITGHTVADLSEDELVSAHHLIARLEDLFAEEAWQRLLDRPHQPRSAVASA